MNDIRHLNHWITERLAQLFRKFSDARGSGLGLAICKGLVEAHGGRIRAGRNIELTATEFELLRVLSLNAGRVTTSLMLLKRVWAKRGNGDTKVVRAFVKQLRQKLGDDAANPAWIFNVRGVGYRMPRPGESA